MSNDRRHAAARARSGERGFSLPELLLVAAIIIVLCSLAVPHVLAGRRAANEASAAQSVRTIISSQQQYYQARNRYASSLADLTPYGLSDSGLAAGEKGGYDFKLDSQTPGSFVISACPDGGLFWSGTRRLAAVEDGQLRADTRNLGTHFTHDEALATPTFRPN